MKELIQRVAGLVYEANQIEDRYHVAFLSSEIQQRITIGVSTTPHHGEYKIADGWAWDDLEAMLEKGVAFLQEYLDKKQIPRWVDKEIISNMVEIAVHQEREITNRDIAEIFDVWEHADWVTESLPTTKGDTHERV